MMLMPITKVRKTIKHYLKNKIPFRYTMSLRSMSVTCPMGSFSSNNTKFPPHELSFIKQVKKTIIDNGLHHNIKYGLPQRQLNEKPVYFAYNKKISHGDVFDTVYNVDIKSAYWETAYQLGLLPDAIYKRGKDPNQISKKSRLAAIGSLARKQSVYEYDGRTQSLVEDRQEETEFLWNIICCKTGSVLLDVAKATKNDFIFFWVDGIYVSSKKAADKAVAIFNKYGYESSITKLKSATVTRKHILVRTGEVKTKMVGGNKIISDVKPFHYSGKSKNKI